jgi:ribosomal protein L40E
MPASKTWKVAAGDEVAREAERLGTGPGRGGDAVRITLEPPAATGELILSGTLQCHGCRTKFPFKGRALIGLTGGAGKGICPRCANQIHIEYSSEMVDKNLPGKGYVLFAWARPWTGVPGRLRYPVRISVENVEGTWSGPREEAAEAVAEEISAPNKYCTDCGASMPTDAIYCPQCGIKQIKEVASPSSEPLQSLKPHEQIATTNQAQAIYHQADVLYKRGDFPRAIALYDKLLEAGLANPYEVRKGRAMACCKAGRFSEAEQELKQLLEVLKSHGAPVASSQVMYWYLVAHYKGDEKKAMDEFVRL